MTIKTPDWVKDAIFYQIFPERFARSERVEKPTNLEPWDAPPTRRGFKGGDLLGIKERLDYLEALGITAIYFNPIFQSAANHAITPTTITASIRFWAATRPSASCWRPRTRGAFASCWTASSITPAGASSSSIT